MDDDYGPPGQPHVIRWRSRRLATVEDGEATLAMLQIIPGGPPEYEILREPATTEGKAQLLSCLVWALEQYERRIARQGAADAAASAPSLQLRRLPLGT